MYKQKPPLAGIDPRKIFEVCVNGFESAKKRSRLLSYVDEVETSAGDYLEYIPFDIEHFPEHSTDPQDKNDLVSVYDQKFVIRSANRPYYDEIRNSTGGRCAICNIGAASTLDHYLPKSEFPLLCVLPVNLVPECNDCNTNKRSYFFRQNNMMLLHPYFDDFAQKKWLDVKIVFSEEMDIEYYNSYTEDILMANRISKTMETYKLYQLFALQANSEMAARRYIWKMTLDEAGETSLKRIIINERTSREKIDINSWASALYRALEVRFEEFVTWLQDPW